MSLMVNSWLYDNEAIKSLKYSTIMVIELVNYPYDEVEAGYLLVTMLNGEMSYRFVRNNEGINKGTEDNKDRVSFVM